MRLSLLRLWQRSSEAPLAFEWGVIGFLGLCSLALAAVFTTVDLGPVDQSILAVVTAILFLICNRRPGRPMTLFLTVLSGLVSMRYIVWRVTETLEFNTVLQGFLGTGLALAEAYAVVVLALGYIQTVWPLERQPVALPDDHADWPTVDVY